MLVVHARANKGNKADWFTELAAAHLALLSPLAHGQGASHACVAVAVVRWFAFRKMLGCGVCKWHGSSMWQDFTAMRVHYFTQPLPGPLSFYAHHFSADMHTLSLTARRPHSLSE